MLTSTQVFLCVDLTWNNPSLCPDVDIVPCDGSTHDLSPSNLCSLTRYVSSQILGFFTYCTRAGIIPGLWIHWMWHTILWKWELSIRTIEWTLYSSSTVGTEGAVHFMEYTFWLYANVYLGHCKWSVCNTVESHFLGLSIRQDSTVVAWCSGIDMWMVPC